jgi:hypothetical protein
MIETDLILRGDLREFLKFSEDFIGIYTFSHMAYLVRVYAVGDVELASKQ